MAAAAADELARERAELLIAWLEELLAVVRARRFESSAGAAARAEQAARRFEVQPDVVVDSLRLIERKGIRARW